MTVTRPYKNVRCRVCDLPGWGPARPLRASWEWRLMFSDWCEDTLIPWLRRRPAPVPTPDGAA